MSHGRNQGKNEKLSRIELTLKKNINSGSRVGKKLQANGPKKQVVWPVFVNTGHTEGGSKRQVQSTKCLHQNL